MSSSKFAIAIQISLKAFLFCTVIGYFNPCPLRAQQITSHTSRFSQSLGDRGGLRLLIIPSIGVGYVTGDVDGDVTTHYVRPGVSLTGTVTMLLTSRSEQPLLGFGVITGASTTIGRRAVYKERIWINGWEFRSVDGIFMQPKVYFAGPLLQINMLRGQLRGQFGRTWNKSDWDTNLFAYVHGSGNWTTKDDQTGDGIILTLAYRSILLSLAFHELEGRTIFPKEGPPQYSIPIYSRTTWMTLGISF